MAQNYIVGIYVFLSLLTVGLCINCFQCNSAEDPACANLTVNDTTSRYYKPCDGNYDGKTPFCRKYVTSVIRLEDSTRIDRSCGWILDNHEKMDTCKKGDGDFLKKTVCICSKEGCNTSARSGSYLFLTIFNSIFVVVLYNIIC
ncbi:unnamed protein product [Phaedon cochleariae]|uniref:Protein sleepless n=1 Tax=Phaedon cochleariae TaxID=80249 RepID=A0A9P0DCN7_PHACE|nr:unnamed protein product [Phaedon cochleariae]